MTDCTFLYFKPSGKWKYEGRGVFPTDFVVDRRTIMAANGGSMPGINGDAADLVVVVIPDEDCSHNFAYPRMLKEIA